MQLATDRLRALAERFCEAYGLKQVYFTRRFGKRNHFLAGFGEIVFDRAERIPLSEHLQMHWHGPLDEAGRREVREIAEPIAQSIEREIDQ
jgi:hypothetical protein